MKALLSLIVVFCCWQLTQWRGFADSSSPGEQPSSETHSSTTGDSSDQLRQMQSTSQQRQTAGQQSGPSESKPHSSELPREGGASEHLRDTAIQDGPRPALAGRGHLAERPHAAKQPKAMGMGAHSQPPLNQTFRTAKEAAPRQTTELHRGSTSAAGNLQRTSALPVDAAHHHGPAPLSVGGPTRSAVPGTTVALNGTGLKHKP
jgi:hypothetical protein